MTSHLKRETKARGPYRTGLKRRREIVEAATLVFGQYGYHGGSLRTIAEMVGTTPATLVSYFTSKELLLVAVLENWSTVTPPTAGGHGLSSFRTYISLMAYHVEHPGLIQLFLTMSTEATQPDHPARPFILERQQRTKRIMMEEIQHAIDAGEIVNVSSEAIETEARLMMGVLDGVELNWLADRTLDLQGVVRHYIDATIVRWTGRSADDVRRDTDAFLESPSVHVQLSSAR